MKAQIDVRPNPETLTEITAAFERSRQILNADTAVALSFATTDAAGRLPALGQPDLQLDVPAGSLLVGLALLHDSVLLPTPPDRVLNRNVRGLLRGLRAQWFGTEHLVVAGRPVGWVGFDRDDASRVLLVAVVGVDAAIATVPATSMRGREYTSLREAGEPAPIAELIERIVAGHRKFGVE